MGIRLPQNILAIPENVLVNISTNDISAVISHASGLDLTQILDILDLDFESLNQIEQDLINKAFKRGKAEAISKACDSLFDSMKSRNGGQSALEYLKHTSAEFQAEVVANSSSGFALNVVLKEE